ncbi:MAG: ATP-dependent helicase [Lachnospiraceae bacterium]|nr:ATP-dependent helicase [Lachnospiraceae bacterium]
MSEIQYTDSQMQAINWNDGSVIVLAGPGSGKTAVLTERIIRLLKESETDSFRILALTFTNKAATEMGERITAGIDHQNQRLFIGTFHSFCSDVLRNHGSYVGLKPDFDIYSSSDDLKAVINEVKMEYCKQFSDENIEGLNLLNAIQYFEKKLCLTEKEVDDAMPKTRYQDVFKWTYFKYLEKLLALNALDFDMLILLTYKLFKEYPNIARIYRNMYRYINVDEFQDTNYGQYTLLKTLCGQKNHNLFIVADDDQVIYGWNGASYERLSEFRKDFNAGLIQLYQNFRCPEKIVALANHLIAHNSGRTANKKPLEAMKKSENVGTHNVCIKEFGSFDDEVYGVTETIIKMKEKYPNDSICVLTRTNRLLDKAYNLSVEKGIDCAKSKRKDEFETPYVLFIYDMLKLANHRNDDKTLVQLLTLVEVITGRSISHEEVILQAEVEDGDLLKSFCSRINGIFDDEMFERSIMLNLCEGKDFLAFIDDAFCWSEANIEKIENTEMKEQTTAEYKAERNVWKEIQNGLWYNYSRQEITISTFMQEFSMVSKEGEPSKDCVQFLTIHASKGKEFDNVFLIGMVDDELPSFQSLKHGDNSAELEEERRNCFVAITRSKKRLFMTYSKQYFNWTKKPSRFLKEMFQD